MLENLRTGLAGERSLTVGEEQTAAHWGSGELYVFATPHMIGMMEQTAVSVVDPLLPDGFQTVGIVVDIRHLAPTPVGSRVTARAELVEIDGRKLTFRVEASDETGRIGEGTHQRFIIEMESFMQKAARRRTE